MSEPKYYILIDRKPVEVEDVLAWAERFDIGIARIGEDFIGHARVSTMFLGVSPSPCHLLFETIVFGGPLDRDQWRYRTYEEAEIGHQEVVTKVRIAAAKIRSIEANAGAAARTPASPATETG